MPKNIWRGDAPDQAQVSRIAAPPAGVSLTISMNGKTLGTWTEFDAEAIANAWNASDLPEFSEVTASAGEDAVILTANIPGIPFGLTAHYGGSTITSEKQLITIGNSPTGGTFTLSYGAATTTALAYNANAATIQAALEALSVFEAGDITVSLISAGLFEVTFTGRYAGLDADTLIVDYSNLRGGTAEVTVTTVRPYSAAQNKKVRVDIEGAVSGYHEFVIDGTDIVTPIMFDQSEASLVALFDSKLGEANNEVTDVVSVPPSDYESVTGERTVAATHTGYASEDPDGVYWQSVSNQNILVGKEESRHRHGVVSFHRGATGTLAGTVIPGNAIVTSAHMVLTPTITTNDSTPLSTIIKINDELDLNDPSASQTDVVFYVASAYESSDPPPGGTPWSIPNIATGSPINSPNLAGIINTYLDGKTWDDIEFLCFVIECTSPNYAVKRWFEKASAKLVITFNVPLVGSSGRLLSYTVELKGTYAASDHAVTINEFLYPDRLNSIYQLDTLDSNGGPWELGAVQLLQGTRLIDQIGSLEAGDDDAVTFLEGLTELMEKRLPENDYIIRPVSGSWSAWEVELRGNSGGENDPFALANLTVRWYPIEQEEQEEPEEPVAQWLKKATGGGGQGEVISVTYEARRGTVAYRVGSATTDSIPFDASTATLQTALAGLAGVGAGNVEVSGSPGAYRIEFDDSLGDVTFSAVNNLQTVVAKITSQTVSGSSPVTSTIVVKIEGVPTTGQGILQLNGIGVAFTPSTTSAAMRAAVLEALPWASAVDVTWNPATGGTVTVSGSYGVSAVLFNNTLAGMIPVIEVETELAYSASGNTVYELKIPYTAEYGTLRFTRSGLSRNFAYPNTVETVLPETLRHLISGSVVGDFRIRSLSGDGEFYRYSIELNGTNVAGNDYTIGMTSDLEPYDNSVSLTFVDWEQTQEGTEGAFVSVETLQHGKPAEGEVQLVTVPEDVHYGTFTLSLDAEASASIDFDGTAAEIETAIEALTAVGSGNVDCTGDLQGIGVRCEFDPTLTDVDLMAVTETDITNGKVTISTSQPGGVAAFTTATESRGKWHYDDPLNWTLGRIPQQGDDVIFETGIEGPLYGLRQASTFTVDTANNRLFCAADFRSGQIVRLASSDTLPAGVDAETDYYIVAIDRDAGWIKLSESFEGSVVDITDEGTGTHYVAPLLNSLVQFNRFSGAIGLPLRNDAGYYEYRNRYLILAMDPDGEERIEIGRGEESGSGLMRLHALFGSLDLTVFETGSSNESGAPALNVICNDDLARCTFYDGDSGLAFFEGEAAKLKTIIKRGGDVRGGEVTMAANGSISHDGEFPNIRKLFESTGVIITQDA